MKKQTKLLWDLKNILYQILNKILLYKKKIIIIHILKIEIIFYYYNNLWKNHFSIKKIVKFLLKKYN